MSAGTRKYDMGRLVDGEHLPPPPAPTAIAIKDTAGMRGFLLKQMVLAAEGKLDTERVKNVCALAQQVYHATKLELEAARILKSGESSIRTLELTDGDGN
jgi:hypothetical protein